MFYHVFLAHDSNDKQKAENLYDELKKLQLEVFLDDVNIRAGDEWPVELKNAQKNSFITVVLLSKNLKQEKYQGLYFNSEIHHAIRLTKESSHVIIPVDLESDSITPYGLDDLQHLTVSRECGLKDIAYVIKQRLLESFPDKNNSEHTQSGQGMIIFGKISSFSEMGETKQQNMISLLTNEISSFKKNVASIRWLDFRVGEFVLFSCWDNSRSSSSHLCIDGLAWGFKLHSTLKAQKIEIGLAVDWENYGQTIKIDSIPDSSTHWFGPAFTRAPTLTEFSNRPHVLVSHEVYSQLSSSFDAGQIEVELKTCLDKSSVGLKDLSEQDKIVINGLGFKDRNKVTDVAYNIYVSREGKNGIEVIYGNNSDPQQKVWIEYRDELVEEKLNKNPFVMKLIEADKVCVLGVTNENLVKFLNAALRGRENNFWNYLRIIFPSVSVLERIVDQHDIDEVKTGKLAIKERECKWEDGQKEVYRFLLSQGGQCDWECLEFDGNLAFIGQRFSLKNDNKLSSIRIAPVLPGIDFKESFYMEGFSGTKMFDKLDKAIDVIIEKSIPMVEWNIYGDGGNDQFILKGLTNLKRRNKLATPNFKPSFLVVLVMLHIKNRDSHLAVLQKRNLYNATSNFERYSNITGWVTDRDLFAGLKLSMSSEYKRINYFDRSTTDRTASIKFKAEIKDSNLKIDSAVTDETLTEIAKYAAQREIREELGMEIDINELISRNNPPSLTRKDGVLLFKVFTFQVNEEKLHQTKIIRPQSNLYRFNLKQLETKQANDELNALLQNHFFDYFFPLYNSVLGIDTE